MIRCKLCSYFKQSCRGFIEGNFTTGRGKKDSEVMLIFDSPFMNDLHSESIASDSEYNNYLNRYLEKIGLSLNSIYVTTFIKCFISDKKKKPTKVMKQKCYDLYLKKEIDEVKPKVIILIGRMVTQWFIPDVNPKVPLKQVMGKSFYNAEYDCSLVPVYDMFYLTNFSNKCLQIRQTEKAFAKAGSILKQDIVRLQKKVEYSNDLKDLNNLGEYISSDVETTGLDSLSDKIVTIALTDVKTKKTVSFDAENFGAIVPCGHKECNKGQIPNQEKIEKLAKAKTDLQKKRINKLPETIECPHCAGAGKRLIEKPEKNPFYTEVLPACARAIKKRKVVFHNGGFDLKFLYAAGYDLFNNLISDTRMMQFLLNPLGANALGFLVQLYFGISYKEEIDRAHILALSMEDRRYYCAEDTYYTATLFMNLYRKLKEQGSLISNKILTNMIKIIASDLEFHGIKIDEKKAYEIIDFYQAEKDKYETKFKKKFDLPVEFNLNSSKQLTKLLYEDLQLPVYVKTDKGNPSCNEEAIKKLASKRPSLKVLVNYRTVKGHIEKLRGYIRAIGVDGRIHSSFNPFSPDSSRVMSSKPNIQNVPRLSRIKEIFVPEPGYTHVYYDYCLAPETKLLTNDFIHKACKDISVGETLIGFDETGKYRKFKHSQVEKVEKFLRPCYRVVTEEGHFICGEDHPWLYTKQKKGKTPQWTQTKNMKIGGYLTKVSEVWETPNNSDCGWMGGFLDGEGNIPHGSCIAWGQNNVGDNKLVLDKSISIATKYGISDLRYSPNKANNVMRIQPAGLRQGWQVIGTFQPIRLKVKAQRLLENQGIRSHNNRKVKILGMEFLGYREVIGIRTTSKTFIAEGFLSHNCQIEFRVWLDLSNDSKGIEFVNNDRDIHAFIAAQFYREPEEKFLKPYRKEHPEYDEKRNKVKTIVYGSMYGRSPEGIVAEHGGSLEEAEQIQKLFFQLCREGWIWLNQIEQRVFKHKKLMTPFGTLRLFPDIELAKGRQREEIVRQAKSFIVQSWAVEMVFIGMFKVWEKIREKNLDAHYVHQIHDAGILEVKDCDVEKVKEIILKYAQSPYPKLKVPLTADIKIGKNWQEIA